MRQLMSIIVILVFSGVSSSGICESSVSDRDAKEVKRSWRPSPKGTPLILELRSNANHFWRFARFYSEHLIAPQFLTEGWVVGDAHNGNFGDIWLGGQNRFAVVDIDDGGLAPFILDLARYLVLTDSASGESIVKDLWPSYLKGVNGRATSPPAIVKKALDIKPREFEREKKKYIAGIVGRDGRFRFGSKADLQPLSRASWDHQREFSTALPLFAQELHAYSLLDFAYKVKVTGGSQGLPRFWVSLANDSGGPEIVEFKRMADPATVEWGPQPTQAERLKQILLYYWSAQRSENLFRHVIVENNEYWMRRRSPSFIRIADVPKSKKEKSEFRDYSIFVANQMGFLHGRQSSAVEYIKRLKGDPESVLVAIEKFNKSYLAAVKELRKRSD